MLLAEIREEKIKKIGIFGVCLYALSILWLSKLNQSIWIMLLSFLFFIPSIKNRKMRIEYKLIVIFILLLPVFEFFSIKPLNEKNSIEMIRESYKFFPIFLIPFFIDSENKIKVICGMVGLTVIGNCANIYYVCKKNGFNFIGTYDGILGLGHTSHCMAGLSFLILGLVLYSVKNKNKIIGIFSFVSYVVCVYFVILGQRRGAYLSILIPIIIFLILFLNKKLLVIMMLIFGLSLAGATQLEIVRKNIYYKRLMSIKDTKASSPTVRLILWDASLKIFKEHPIFGVGEDGGSKYYLKYIEENKEEVNRRLGGSLSDILSQANFSNPHNMYLKKMVDMGVLSIYLFGVFGYIGIKNLRKIFEIKKKNESIFYLFLGVIGAYLAFFIIGLTEDAWGTYVIKNMFFLTLGLNFSIFKILDRENN